MYLPARTFVFDGRASGRGQKGPNSKKMGQKRRFRYRFSSGPRFEQTAYSRNLLLPVPVTPMVIVCYKICLVASRPLPFSARGPELGNFVFRLLFFGPRYVLLLGNSGNLIGSFKRSCSALHAGPNRIFCADPLLRVILGPILGKILRFGCLPNRQNSAVWVQSPMDAATYRGPPFLQVWSRFDAYFPRYPQKRPKIRSNLVPKFAQNGFSDFGMPLLLNYKSKHPENCSSYESMNLLCKGSKKLSLLFLGGASQAQVCTLCNLNKILCSSKTVKFEWFWFLLLQPIGHMEIYMCTDFYSNLIFLFRVMAQNIPKLGLKWLKFTYYVL